MDPCGEGLERDPLPLPSTMNLVYVLNDLEHLLQIVEVIDLLVVGQIDAVTGQQIAGPLVYQFQVVDDFVGGMLLASELAVCYMRLHSQHSLFCK
jgi:hypothetical protein